MARDAGPVLREAPIDLPMKDPVAAARIIAETLCGLARLEMHGDRADGRYIRKALQAIKPDLQIAINTLPFFLSDFDNAVEEVFGQVQRSCKRLPTSLRSWPITRSCAGIRLAGCIATDIKRRSG